MNSMLMRINVCCVSVCLHNNKFSALIQIIIFSAPLTEPRDSNANFMSDIIAVMFT